MAKVQVVVNPALRRFTDRVEIGELVFTHDEPVALSSDEYEELAATHKVRFQGSELQLLTKATPRQAADAEADGAGDKPAKTKAAKAEKGGTTSGS